MILQNYTSLYEKDATERYYQRIGKKVPAKLQDKSAFEKLMKYKFNSKAFFSFRDIYRIGINPNSKWTTPNGIYTYPLKAVSTIKKDRYDLSSDKIKVPFVGDKPIIYVVESVGRGIKDLNLYTEANLTDDVEKLKKAMRMKVNQRYVKDFLITLKSPTIMGQIAIDASIIPSALQNCKTIIEYIDILSSFSSIGARVNTFGGRLWYITYYLAKGIMGLKFSNVWNSIFRKFLKYNFVVDLGQSIIHPNESYQAVFFNTKSFKVLDVIENKYPTESVGEREVVRQGRIEWDNNFRKATLKEVLEIVKKRKADGWRLPTPYELGLAYDSNLKGFIKSIDVFYLSNDESSSDYILKSFFNGASEYLHKKDSTIFSREVYYRLVKDFKADKDSKSYTKLLNKWITHKNIPEEINIKKDPQTGSLSLLANQLTNVSLYDFNNSNPVIYLYQLYSILKYFPGYSLPTVTEIKKAYEKLDIFGYYDNYWCVKSPKITLNNLTIKDLYIFNGETSNAQSLITTDKFLSYEVSKNNIALVKRGR
jgi:hypothetical protein